MKHQLRKGGILDSGVMGTRIAQVGALAGYDVALKSLPKGDVVVSKLSIH